VIQLFYPRPVPGFGSDDRLFDSVSPAAQAPGGGQLPADLSEAVAGGSMVFLTPFSREDDCPTGKLVGKLELSPKRLQVPCALRECRGTHRLRLPPPAT
jgi:hypothetical protein